MSTVEAWVLPGSAAVDEGCLAPPERARAAAMGAPHAAARHLRGRAALRHAVAAGMGLPARAVPLSRAGRGRPVVELGDGPWGSVAHTRDVVTVAMCRDSPVGIDVEVVGARQRPVPAVVLADERRAAVAPLVDEAVVPLAVWVVLEAALKAAGTGFAQAQRAIRFTSVADGVMLDLPSGGTHGCRLRVLPGGIVVAVATPATVPAVHWHASLPGGVGPPRTSASVARRAVEVPAHG